MIRMRDHYQVFVHDVIDIGPSVHPLVSLTDVPTRRTAQTQKAGEVTLTFDGFRNETDRHYLIKSSNNYSPKCLSIRVNMIPSSEQHTVSLGLKFTNNSFYEIDFTKVEIGIVSTSGIAIQEMITRMTPSKGSINSDTEKSLYFDKLCFITTH